MISYLVVWFLPLIALFFVVAKRIVDIRNGTIIVSLDYDGVLAARTRLEESASFLGEKLAQYRKLFLQYLLHILVRFLSWWKDVTQTLYAISRNYFLKTAVKNKDSVSLFWEHLKEYKTQIEKEREETINDKQ